MQFRLAWMVANRYGPARAGEHIVRQCLLRSSTIIKQGGADVNSTLFGYKTSMTTSLPPAFAKVDSTGHSPYNSRHEGDVTQTMIMQSPVWRAWWTKVNGK